MDLMADSDPRASVEPPAELMSPLQRALFPDIAAIVALVVLFYALFAHEGPSRLLLDSDTGWHIVTGERILATGELPRTDPYSFSRPGGAWFAWEWLCDILLGAIHRGFGLSGVVFAAALAIALAAWLWARFNRAIGGDSLFTAILIGLAMTCTSVHWLARPHVFSWSFLIGLLWALERAPARFTWLHGACVVVFMALWTNIHGSFFLAFPIAGAYALQYWFENRLRARWVGYAALCGAAATFLNPSGWHLHGHVVRYLTNTQLLSRINEYKSYDFHSDGSLMIMTLFMLTMAGAVLCAQQRQWARALLILLCLAIAFRSVRGIPLLALAATPAVNAAFAAALRRLRWTHTFFEESANFSRRERQSNGAAWLIAGLIGAIGLLASPAVSATVGFPGKRLPVHLSATITTLPHDSRIFSTDYFGGYLIYRFNGERKVFVDGRSDYYGAQFIDDYLKVLTVSPGWRPIFAKYSFTHALVPVKTPLLDALEHDKWQRLGADETAVLLRAP